jgi:hypothetical protein
MERGIAQGIQAQGAASEAAARNPEVA